MTLNTMLYMTGNNSVAVKNINLCGKQFNFRVFKEIIEKYFTLPNPYKWWRDLIRNDEVA